MRIGMFADSFLPDRNGLVTVVCELTKEFIRRNMDVSLYVPGENSGREEYQGAVVHRLRGYPVPFYPSYRLAMIEAWRIPRILEEQEIDVYHVHDPFSIGVVAMRSAKLRRKPIVGTFHTHFAEYLPYIGRSRLYTLTARIIGKNLAWTYLKNFYKRCHVITVPSHEMKKTLTERIREKEVIVIPNGIDLHRFHKRYGRDEARRLLSLPEDATIYLYLGRMSLEKRLDLLLKAYKAMEGRDTLLILAGEGPRLKRLREIATALDIKNIAFLGGVPDSMLTPLYSASDVYVSASDTETFGLTFLEAMACGLPLLGVDSGGAKEMIIDGENGLVAKANNVIDLARKMESMKEEGRRRIMGEHSLRIARRYSIERVADQFLNIYKRYIN